jgi:hypothetical protein
LFVGACDGIGTQVVTVASGECDGSSAIIRGATMTAASAVAPAPEDVSNCIQDVFRSNVCLDLFQNPYPFLASLSLGLDVPSIPLAVSSLSPSLSPRVEAPILSVPEDPDYPDDSYVAPGDGTIPAISGLEQEPINGPAPGSAGSTNITAIAGSAAGVALLFAVLVMFAFNRQKKKAWRDGAIHTATLDEVDIEAHQYVIDSLHTKDGLFAPPDSSDTGSSLLGRMLASTATAAFGALTFRSENNDECCTQEENSFEDDLASARDDLTLNFEGANAVKPKIVPVSILKNAKRGIGVGAPIDEDETLAPVAPGIVSAPAPDVITWQGANADSPDDNKARTKTQTPRSPAGLLTCAMHPFHFLAPTRCAVPQDQMSEGSSVPYHTDFGPDQSWDPDDNSIGSSNNGVDFFQAAPPASPIDRKRLLDSVAKKSFEMQRLRTPAEPEPRRPKSYL